MNETQLVNAGLKFLSLCDPNDGGFWGIKVAYADDLPGANDANNKVLLTAPEQNAAGQPAPERNRAYYRTAQTFERSLFEPIKRFLSLATGIHLQLTPKDPNTGLPGPSPFNEGFIALSMVRDTGPFSIAYTITGSLHPQFLLPSTNTSIEFRAIINLDRLALPLFLPLPPRKVRKWGRALTPKWEAEHAQIVAARAFKRNAKRAKEGKLPRRKPTPDEACNAKADARAYLVKLAALGTLDSAVKRIKHAGRRAAARKVQRQVAHRLAKIRAPKK